MSSELLYQQQSPRICFKKWLLREYSDRRLMGHPFWQLAFEIEAKWPDFPEKGNYLTLAMFLKNKGACHRCLKSFRGAWENYIADG